MNDDEIAEEAVKRGVPWLWIIMMTTTTAANPWKTGPRTNRNGTTVLPSPGCIAREGKGRDLNV
eukprot:scaffold244_cov172-Amphora_coffeaeformis.AAC.31